MFRRTLLSLALVLTAVPLAAQRREITGKVTQAGTGTPVTEATVSIVGAQQGVRTNERGEYRLPAPAGEIQVLARAIGFKRLTVKVAAGSNTADFSLDKDVLQLEGVTVTGQATTVDRRNASTAIAAVSAEELMVAPAKSLEGNLAGKVVGATIFENSGVPGGGMQIQIRGATSILGQGDPLYIVDGVIVSNASVNGGLAVDLAFVGFDDEQPGPDGQPSRRHQSERHREHRSPEVGRGDRHLRFARDERRRRDHDEAR